MFRTCFSATVREVAGARQACITSRFDLDSTGIPPESNLLEFCFPLGAASVTPREYQAAEEFLFVLTGGAGDRLWGFCRRSLLPAPVKNGVRKAATPRYPWALCIISEHPWSSVFFRVLEAVDRILRTPPSVGAGGCVDGCPDLEKVPFLADFGAAGGGAVPALGSVIGVPFPQGVPGMARQHRSLASPADPDSWLAAGEQGVLELEIPPDMGAGPATAGIPLAPLLWRLTPRLMLSLLGALLMERRVVLVSSDLGRLSSAVAAAAALIYPLCWQHILLPIVPVSFIDVLAAPMPFLVGLPTVCLPQLESLSMEECLLIDLDTLGKAEPLPGGPRDDALLLPYADALEAAFDELRDLQRSPAEGAATARAAEVVRSWTVKVLGPYRLYLRPDAPPCSKSGIPLDLVQTHPPPRSRFSRGPSLGAMTFELSGNEPRDNGELVAKGNTERPATSNENMKGDEGTKDGTTRPSPSNPSQTLISKPILKQEEDTSIRAYGQVFDLEGFLASGRRQPRLAAFYAAFRHSQMFEMFVIERCAAAAAGYPLTDAFEAEVSDTIGYGCAAPLAAAANARAQRAALVDRVRFGTLWRKTSDAVRISSGTLVSTVKNLTSLQDDTPLPGQAARAQPGSSPGEPVFPAGRSQSAILPGVDLLPASILPVWLPFGDKKISPPAPDSGRSSPGLAPLAAGMKSLDEAHHHLRGSDSDSDAHQNDVAVNGTTLQQGPVPVPAVSVPIERQRAGGGPLGSGLTPRGHLPSFETAAVAGPLQSHRRSPPSRAEPVAVHEEVSLVEMETPRGDDDEGTSTGRATTAPAHNHEAQAATLDGLAWATSPPTFMDGPPNSHVAATTAIEASSSPFAALHSKSHVAIDTPPSLHPRWLPARAEVFAPLASSTICRSGPSETQAWEEPGLVATGPLQTRALSVASSGRTGSGGSIGSVTSSAGKGNVGRPLNSARGRPSVPIPPVALPPTSPGVTSPEERRASAAAAARAAECAALRDFSASLDFGKVRTGSAKSPSPVQRGRMADTGLAASGSDIRTSTPKPPVAVCASLPVSAQVSPGKESMTGYGSVSASFIGSGSALPLSGGNLAASSSSSFWSSVVRDAASMFPSYGFAEAASPGPACRPTDGSLSRGPSPTPQSKASSSSLPSPQKESATSLGVPTSNPSPPRQSAVLMNDSSGQRRLTMSSSKPKSDQTKNDDVFRSLMDAAAAAALASAPHHTSSASTLRPISSASPKDAVRVLDRAMQRPVIAGEPLRPSERAQRRLDVADTAPPVMTSPLYRSLASPLAAAATGRLSENTSANIAATSSVNVPRSLAAASGRQQLRQSAPNPIPPSVTTRRPDQDLKRVEVEQRVRMPENPYLMDTLRMAGGDVAAWSSWKASAPQGVLGNETNCPPTAAENPHHQASTSSAAAAASLHGRTGTFVERSEPQESSGLAPWAQSNLPTMKLG